MLKSKIQVLIVDDQEVVRRSLAVFLRAFDDFMLIGEATNGLEAVQLCASLQPHVILMDLTMPEMDGITATRIISETYPQIHVIVLTSFSEQRMAESALAAGADRYLGKTSSIDELANAIRAVCPALSRL
jgi:two-component system, NarL family, response regulator LiaR